MRISGDFKVTINSHLAVDQYPLPQMEEALYPLSDSTEFSVLDMSQAFSQIPIDEESQNLLVINTHKGLLKYKPSVSVRWGLSLSDCTAPLRLESLISGISRVNNRVDDIITGGPDRSAHLDSLRTLLTRLQDKGL